MKPPDYDVDAQREMYELFYNKMDRIERATLRLQAILIIILVMDAAYFLLKFLVG